MSCTSKLQQKFLQRDKRNEWPDDWQNQFIKLKKVWSNKIKTENIRIPSPLYMNTFDNQFLSECVKSDSDSSIEPEYYYKHKEKQKMHKEHENKMSKAATIKSHKKILNEIPCFIEILQQLHDKISNILEMSDEELCRHLHTENKPKHRRKRRPKRKYKLRERYFRTETCSVKSTSPERDYETESIISSDDYMVDQEEMKLSIVHNMSEVDSNIGFSERQDDQKCSIKINYVDRKFQYNQKKRNIFSDTVDDVNQVSSNCLLIPLISNVKRRE